MAKTTNALNWASPDQSKNITLAAATAFAAQLTSALGLQLTGLFVQSTSGEHVTEQELRGNQFESPLPVNLWGELAGGTRKQFNVASFIAEVKALKDADDALTALTSMIEKYLPGTNGMSYLTRMPAVQQAIADALAKL